MARVWHIDNGSHRLPPFHASNGAVGKGSTWLWVGQLLWCQEAALGWISLADSVGSALTKNPYPWEIGTKQPPRGRCTAHTDDKRQTHAGKQKSYPVLCPDHQWGWGWCWVWRCGRDGPSEDETCGDTRTGTQSPGSQETLPAGQGGAGEMGKGPRAPTRPFCYPSVNPSVLGFTRWSRQLRQPDRTQRDWWGQRDTRLHKHADTQKPCKPAADLAQPLQGALPYKCTRSGWAQLVNQSLMMH